MPCGGRVLGAYVESDDRWPKLLLGRTHPLAVSAFLGVHINIDTSYYGRIGHN